MEKVEVSRVYIKCLRRPHSSLIHPHSTPRIPIHPNSTPQKEYFHDLAATFVFAHQNLHMKNLLKVTYEKFTQNYTRKALSLVMNLRRIYKESRAKNVDLSDE